MSRSSRDRISVDLRGLRAALFEQARAEGVRPSDFVRVSIARSLKGTSTADPKASIAANEPSVDRVRLTLRMVRGDALATVRAARVAGLSPGDYVGRLVAGVLPPSTGAERGAQLAELASSSAQLATLSRNLRHLTSLLSQGSVRAAQEYREMLDTLGEDIREHLNQAARLFSELPQSRDSARRAHRPIAPAEEL